MTFDGMGAQLEYGLVKANASSDKYCAHLTSVLDEDEPVMFTGVDEINGNG